MHLTLPVSFVPYLVSTPFGHGFCWFETRITWVKVVSRAMVLGWLGGLFPPSMSVCSIPPITQAVGEEGVKAHRPLFFCYDAAASFRAAGTSFPFPPIILPRRLHRWGHL